MSKYIPPHRRKNTSNQLNIMQHVERSTAQRELIDKYIPPHRRKNTASQLNLTQHAKQRMEQREINVQHIEQTVNTGTMEQNQSSTTHRAGTHFCVKGEKDRIITVMENHRNKDFDYLRSINENRNQLLVRVKDNDDHAMCELAELYLRDHSSELNVFKAGNLFMQAAIEHYNSHAMCKLAQLYRDGLLGSADEVQYWKWMKRAANRGNKYATAIVGQYYMTQYIDTPDTSEREKRDLAVTSMSYFEKSAAKGSTRAMCHIAYINETGLFGEKNLSKAIDLYIKAAKRGSPNALRSLQEMVYLDKIKLDELEDILEIVCLLVGEQSSQMAVKLGIAQIDGKLGRLGPASARGLYMLEKAAHNRNEEAIISLIDIYSSGTNIIEPNSEKVIFWAQHLEKLYKKVAEQGDREAMFDLGELYLSGDLGEVIIDKAVEYFESSIKKRDINKATTIIADCLHGYGQLLLTNSNIKDEKRGVVLIKRAIKIWKIEVDNDNYQAASDIAGVYYCGDLGQPNYEQSIKWFIIAANSGDEWSKYYLAKIYLVKLSESNVDLAISWIEELMQSELEDITQDRLIKLVNLLLGQEDIKSVAWLVSSLTESSGPIKICLDTIVQKQLLMYQKLEESENINHIEMFKWFCLVNCQEGNNIIPDIAKLYTNITDNERSQMLTWLEPLTDVMQNIDELLGVIDLHD